MTLEPMRLELLRGLVARIAATGILLNRDSPDEPQTGVDFCAVAAF
jgi:hypothetical protein